MNSDESIDVSINREGLRPPKYRRDAFRIAIIHTDDMGALAEATLKVFSPFEHPGMIDSFVLRSASRAIDDASIWLDHVKKAIALNEGLSRFGVKPEMPDEEASKLLKIRAIECRPRAVPGLPGGPGLLPNSPAPTRDRDDFSDTLTSYSIVVEPHGESEHLIYVDVRDGRYTHARVE